MSDTGKDVIIGAGVSGLSFANFTSNNDYVILEADAEIGGYCKTVKQDGFVWDYSGHFFHFRNPWLEEYLCRNIDVNSILHCEKHTQIRYKERYIDFPFQKNIHQLEQQEFIDCLYDLFFNAQEAQSSTFKQMLYAKFGKSIAEKFLIPYNEKLYACDLDKLDTDAMGRFFPYADKEEIIKNFKKADNDSYNAHFTYPRGGAIEYINSLYAYIDPQRLSLNERVCTIDPDSKTITTNRRTIQYKHLISTVPFPKLLDYCHMPYDRNIYSWNKVLVFNLGFDKPANDTVNHWIYIPNKTLCFYRVGYYSNIFKDSRMSLYVELGFDKDMQISNPDAYKIKVIEDLSRAGIIKKQQLVSSHSVIMDPAYVHISKASVADVERKKSQLARKDIYSVGRYGSWTYASIEDNILEAKDLACKISR